MKAIITLLTLFLGFTGYSQKTYLIIDQDKSEKSVITYPPGTEFELRNEHNYIVMKNSDTPYVLEIKSKHKLTVFPGYKDEQDVFILTGGKVEKALTVKYSQQDKNSKPLLIENNNVTARKVISDSKTISGYKNLDFTLNNGISFTYIDGKYSAKLRDKYVDIKGKYIIETNLGVLKLSFNPKNDHVWWVFE